MKFNQIKIQLLKIVKIKKTKIKRKKIMTIMNILKTIIMIIIKMRIQFMNIYIMIEKMIYLMNYIRVNMKI